jgi:hypothetical protein
MPKLHHLSSKDNIRFSAKRPDRLWGPHSLLLHGYRDYFQGVMRPGRGADHSTPSSAKIKNEWRYTSTPPICLHGVDRNNFTFFLTYKTCSLVTEHDIAQKNKPVSLASHSHKLCLLESLKPSRGRDFFRTHFLFLSSYETHRIVHH